MSAIEVDTTRLPLLLHELRLPAIARLWPEFAEPWKISFSYGRALQDHALEAWHGRDENLGAGRQALYQKARCNSAASLGRYTGGDAGRCRQSAASPRVARRLM